MGEKRGKKGGEREALCPRSRRSCRRAWPPPGRAGPPPAGPGRAGKKKGSTSTNRHPKTGGNDSEYLADAHIYDID